MEKKQDHILYYFLLASLVLIGALVIFYLSPNKQQQFWVFVIMALAYVVMGIVHHWMNHDLVPKIVIEYLLIAALGVSAVYFILRGGLGF